MQFATFVKKIKIADYFIACEHIVKYLRFIPRYKRHKLKKTKASCLLFHFEQKINHVDVYKELLRQR